MITYTRTPNTSSFNPELEIQVSCDDMLVDFGIDPNEYTHWSVALVNGDGEHCFPTDWANGNAGGRFAENVSTVELSHTFNYKPAMNFPTSGGGMGFRLFDWESEIYSVKVVAWKEVLSPTPNQPNCPTHTSYGYSQDTVAHGYLDPDTFLEGDGLSIIFTAEGVDSSSFAFTRVPDRDTINTLAYNVSVDNWVKAGILGDNVFGLINTTNPEFDEITGINVSTVTPNVVLEFNVPRNKILPVYRALLFSDYNIFDAGLTEMSNGFPLDGNFNGDLTPLAYTIDTEFPDLTDLRGKMKFNWNNERVEVKLFDPALSTCNSDGSNSVGVYNPDGTILQAPDVSCSYEVPFTPILGGTYHIVHYSTPDGAYDLPTLNYSFAVAYADGSNYKIEIISDETFTVPNSNQDANLELKYKVLHLVFSGGHNTGSSSVIDIERYTGGAMVIFNYGQNANHKVDFSISGTVNGVDWEKIAKFPTFPIMMGNPVGKTYTLGFSVAKYKSIRADWVKLGGGIGAPIWGADLILETHEAGDDVNQI